MIKALQVLLGGFMQVDATTALLPVERTASTAMRTAGGHQRGVSSNPSRSREGFVFLGYGPGSGEGLYNELGKHVPGRRRPGSRVDLYA